jgi:hypothetical protein
VAGKQGGLGQRLFVHGSDISTGVQDLSDTGGGFAPLSSTDITQFATAREIGGQRDGRLGMNTLFNPSAGAVHDVLSALPTTDVILTWVFNVSALGANTFSLNAKQADYNATRAQEGSFLFATAAQGNQYGGEFGNTLTLGKRTDGAATNGSGVDFTAATDFGLTAYLHVVAFTGTDVTVKLQESSDNGVGDAWADVVGGGFTQITGGAPTAQRIQTARDLTVERYLRAVTVTTGGFSDLQFVVAVTKPDHEVLF